ncbi:hypothetical protein MTO96_006681 [Rhipicephalus appendiculatus]
MESIRREPPLDWNAVLTSSQSLSRWACEQSAQAPLDLSDVPVPPVFVYKAPGRTLTAPSRSLLPMVIAGGSGWHNSRVPWPKRRPGASGVNARGTWLRVGATSAASHRWRQWAERQGSLARPASWCLRYPCTHDLT